MKFAIFFGFLLAAYSVYNISAIDSTLDSAESHWQQIEEAGSNLE